MRRNLLLSILGLLFASVIAGIYVYSEYNRRNPSVAAMSPDVTINATALVAAFSKDSAAANAAYLGKVIELTGPVKSIDKDAAGTYTISLGDPENLSSVRCSMTADKANLISQKMAGTTVVLKGICTGFMPDDMGLGADVILNRAEIETKSSIKN